MDNQKGEKGDSLVATHRKAHHDFFIEERYETGIVLVGTEVKSLREKRVDITESFARVEKDALYIYNAHISPYKFGHQFNHAPLRKRKLLVSARELAKLIGKVQRKGYTLVPLRLYFNSRGWAKIELALALGKKPYDKREALAKKSAQREIERGKKNVR
jgi:SsrA-binding protein